MEGRGAQNAEYITPESMATLLIFPHISTYFTGVTNKQLVSSALNNFLGEEMFTIC